MPPPKKPDTKKPDTKSISIPKLQVKDVVDIITKYMYTQRLFGKSLFTKDYVEFYFDMCNNDENIKTLNSKYSNILKLLQEKYDAKTLSFKHFNVFIDENTTKIKYCFSFKNKNYEITEISLGKYKKEIKTFIEHMHKKNPWGQITEGCATTGFSFKFW